MKKIFLLLFAFIAINFNSNAATRYAIANGNWSSVSTWDGGVSIPSAGDNVYANNKTVTIDQDVTVASINTLAASPAVAGGQFTISTAHTITANIYHGGPSSQNCFVSTAANNTIVHIIGNVYNQATSSNTGFGTYAAIINCTVTGNVFGGTVGSNGGQCVIGAYGCIIYGDVTGGVISNCCSPGAYNSIIYGNVYCGTVANASYGAWNCQIIGHVIGNGAYIGAYYDNSYSLSSTAITGDQTANGTGVGTLIVNAGNKNLTLAGNVYGSQGSSAMTVLQNTSSGSWTITGNVIMYGVSILSTIGLIDNVGTGSLYVNGNLTGGTAANCIAASLRTTTGKIYVLGTTTGGSNLTNSPAILAQYAGQTVDVVNIISGNYPALIMTGLCTCNIHGNITFVNGVCPFFGVYTQVWHCDNTASQTIDMQDIAGYDRYFSTSGGGQPVASDVRYGVIYGNNSELTGTCIVPSAAYVGLGVLVDNTVGTLVYATAASCAQAVWDYLISNMNTSGSIGERAKNCSTVNTTGAQIQSVFP